MMLRNGGVNDAYATKLRDVFLQSLMKDRAVDIQEGYPCIVFLNGEYWGLYNLQERIGDHYVASKYGIAEEDVIFIKNDEVSTGREEDLKLYTDVVDYAVIHDMRDPVHYDYVSNRIDMDSLIDYFCFLVYVADCDSIDNNFACWRSRTNDASIPKADGKWRYVLVDTDDSTGLMTLLTKYDQDSFHEGMHGHSPLQDPLFSSLVENDAFRERFVTTFLELADTVFSYDHVSPLLTETAACYKGQVVLSQQRFRGEYKNIAIRDGLDYYGDYTPEHFNADVEVIDEFFRNRREYIVKYLNEHFVDAYQ